MLGVASYYAPRNVHADDASCLDRLTNTEVRAQHELTVRRFQQITTGSPGKRWL